MVANRLKRIALAGFAVFAACLCSVTLADASSSIPVTVVMSKDNAVQQDVLNGFKQYLAEEGIQADYTVVIADGHHRPIDFQQQLNAGKPRLILTLGQQASEMTTALNTDVSIIGALVGDFESTEMGANFTGVFINHSLQEQFNLMKRILPRVRRVGVLYNPAENQQLVEVAESVAQKAGITLIEERVELPSNLPNALQSIGNTAQLIWGIADHTVLVPETVKHLLIYSFRNRIPLSGLSEAWVSAGALYALERDYFDIGVQCGEIAVKILNGTSPGAIPPSRPRKVHYMLNLKTARHMKLDIPAEIIAGAERVYD